MVVSAEATGTTGLTAAEKVVVLAIRGGTAVGLMPVVDRCVFAVSGKDAAAFLHNRTTNDVTVLQPGQGQWNGVLDKSAHVLGHCWLGRPLAGEPAPAFWLAVESFAADTTLKALLQYKIMEDITITPQNEWGCVAVFGSQAQQLLASLAILPSTPLLPLGTSDFSWENAHGIVIRQEITGEDGYWVWLPPQTLLSLQAALHEKALEAGVVLETLSAAAYDTLCTEAGTLVASRDYDMTTLLPETGLEQACVSYSKGCYLGQETVARVKTYGSVPKALVGLMLQNFSNDVPLDSLAGELTLEGDSAAVGHVTHGAFSPTLGSPIAFAYLSKNLRAPGKPLTLVLHTLSAPLSLQAIVTPLPFVGGSYAIDLATQRLNQGLSAFAQGHNESALALLRQALALHPTSPDVLEALSAVLGRQGQYEDALTLAQRLVALDPNRVMAYTNLSVFYMQLGDKDKAEEAKAQATLVSFRNAMGSKRPLSTGSSEQSQQKTAAEPELVFTLTPEQRATLEDKVAMFRSALQHSPTDALGNFGLGCALLDLGLANEAIEALKHTVGLKTSQSTAYTKLGQAYELLQEWGNAKQTYAQGIEVASVRRDLMALKTLQDRLGALNGK